MSNFADEVARKVASHRAADAAACRRAEAAAEEQRRTDAAWQAEWDRLVVPAIREAVAMLSTARVPANAATTRLRNNYTNKVLTRGWFLDTHSESDGEGGWTTHGLYLEQRGKFLWCAIGSYGTSLPRGVRVTCSEVKGKTWPASERERPLRTRTAESIVASLASGVAEAIK